MYLGFLLLFLGIGLIASLDWSLPLVPLLWLALDRAIVAREEAYLAGKFGAPYDAFRARTRRWLW
jgi:protein-S-isoprenylcysteine O-methyltransferase Ste14